jgi:hypothetical protein
LRASTTHNVSMIRAYHVLLTACIAPGASVRVARSDPSVRLLDYLAGLEFWLRLEDARLRSVTFVDNSGHSLAELEARAAGLASVPVRFLSAPPTEIPEGIGYGYGELALLDWALANGDQLQSDELVVKATGRLRFPRLPRLLDKVPGTSVFLADAVNKHLPARRTAENGVLRTQLFAFGGQFYREHLTNLWQGMRAEAGHRLIESVLYRAIWPLRARPDVLLRFPVNCSPVGLAAHWDKDYQSPRERMRDGARAITRSVAPWIWS